MRIAIAHYHLRRGGVTRVIDRASCELARRGHDVLVVSGEPPADPLAPGVRVAVVPEAGYSTHGKTPEPQSLAATLRKACHNAWSQPPDVWHFHNHCLGKNRAFAALPALLARDGDAVLMQIHDFAEDGRPDNHAALRESPDKTSSPVLPSLYPAAPRLAYGLLNRRDIQALSDAGMPGEYLAIIPNPVSPPPAPANPIKRRDRMLLYPCRGIRRKNLGEAVYWARRHPDWNLAATLPPENPVELASYRAWVRFCGTENIAIDLAAGTAPDATLGGLLAASSAVLTTSVAEGFGLAFLEPWLADRPVTGRNLPNVTADFRRDGITLDALYDTLPVPLALAGGGKEVESEVVRALQAAYAQYGRKAGKNEYHAAMNAMIDNDQVDFGRLSARLQRHVLHTMMPADPSLPALPAINPTKPAAELAASNRKAIESAYSTTRHADTLEHLYHRVLAAPSDAVDHLDPERVLDVFLNPAAINLLTAPDCEP